MSKSKDVEAAKTNEEEAPKRPPAYTCFVAEIRADYHDKMEVLRWLVDDDFFRVVYILHDRDIFCDDDKEKSGKILRPMPDTDEMKEFQVGDIKPPHYHVMVFRPKKCTAATMAKQFGSYVHFEGCSDAFAYARYLTHETFDSRHKTQYPRSAVLGDVEKYNELLGRDNDVCVTARRWLQYREQATQNGAAPDRIDAEAAKLAIIAGDSALVSSVMSHSYFYSKFF